MEYLVTFVIIILVIFLIYRDSKNENFGNQNETNKKVKYDITNFLYNKNGEFDSSDITRRIVDFKNTISSFIINNNLTVIKNLQNKSAIS